PSCPSGSCGVMNHAGRIARVRETLSGTEAEALLVTNLTNVRYLTGFSGPNGQVLITLETAFFMTDPRYEARAVSLIEGADVVIYRDRLSDVLPERLQGAGVAKLGIESTMTLAQHDDLKERLEVEFVPTKRLVEEARRTKDADELELIRAAVALADDTFNWVLDRLVPGATEREVALDIDMHMRREGAEAVAFPPIVGSGPLSAHIHHTPSDRTFEKGDLVLLDFGCTRDGYCSDLTRTVVLGPATDEQQHLYALVLEAQAAGLAAIRADLAAKTVDAAARDVIVAAGHGDAFGHGLGHGVGLDIHESPIMNRISEDVLRTNDVVTVEPGVYLPEIGGVRIEDCVVVAQEGAEVLGSAPKEELIQL
ncbi:MAG TPA: Xaa-Pro peptidase family protein, partial [Actinomycetota bacterium]|nr:Xaa-Pro peptidase family protein [Actinomycetota bacterium]